MDRSKIIDVLCETNNEVKLEKVTHIGENFQDTLDDAILSLEITFEKLEKFLPFIKPYSSDTSYIFKYISVHLYGLCLLKESLEKTEVDDELDEQQTRKLKENTEIFLAVGIRSNLLPCMPTYRVLSDYQETSDLDIETTKYNRLVVTVLGLMECGPCKKLQTCIFYNLRPIIAGFYQLAYCPLKAPTDDPVAVTDTSTFVMTTEIYNKLTEDRKMFMEEYKKFLKWVHSASYVRETMMLMNEKSPNWVKRAITHNMDTIMTCSNGVKYISRTLLVIHSDYDSYDRAKTWKALSILVKLIFKFETSPDFLDNIVPQVIGLLKSKHRHEPSMKAFENLLVLCTKFAYENHKCLAERVFLSKIKEQFQKLVTGELEFHSGEDITKPLGQSIRLIYSSFVLQDVDLAIPVLPVNLLDSVICVIFYIYSCIPTSNIDFYKTELKEILVKYIENQTDVQAVFDAFIFGIIAAPMVKRSNLINLEVDDKRVIIKINEETVRPSVSINADLVLELCKSKDKLLFDLFVYLLQCINNREKYFSAQKYKDVLSVEDTFIIHEGLERNLAVYNLLSTLSEDKNVQKLIIKQPTQMVSYIYDVLQSTINKKTHQSKNIESDEFHSLFLVTMVLQALTATCSRQDLIEYDRLLPSLHAIARESTNKELKDMVNQIVENTKREASSKSHEIKSEIDEAIQCVCDPLLPIRGHGLMSIAILLEKRDKGTLERKQYILNIFQQNLKTEDSYIYLSAIRGLAALGDIFPESVLTILCEEYSDYKSSDFELRMKLGEALVRITRTLGATAPKYKALLLNTFLTGSKDDDNLIRASSLSNLGEVCKVLGYKLGSIVTEVLTCVHAVITTDKAVEARRAAVSVLRMLFVGLETDMLTFLKDDILEIYKSLKNIYYSDADDVMKLQAQLALEELDANMTKIIFATPSLILDKKPILLDSAE